MLLRPWESCTPPRRRGRERGETRCNVSPACSHREAVESLVTRRCPDVRGGLSRQLLQSGILVPLRGGGGGPAGAPPPLAVRTPATGSHSPAREEEFSHRRTQQGSLSRGGEVSTGPCPTRSEECRAKGHAARSPQHGLRAVAVLPARGAARGERSANDNRTATAHLVAANTQTPEGFSSQSGSDSCGRRGQEEWALRCAGLAFRL